MKCFAISMAFTLGLTVAGAGTTTATAGINPVAVSSVKADAQDTALALPDTYTVRAGDTVSIIAQREYGNVDRWPALWWVNRKAVPNPNVIHVGERLRLSRWHPVKRWLTQAADKAAGVIRGSSGTAESANAAPSGRVIYSFTQLEALWVAAGGPAGYKWDMATIAECESGGDRLAYNPSGASGLWQILGQVVPGYIFNAWVNALNAVKKFKDAVAAGESGMAPWVCQA